MGGFRTGTATDLGITPAGPSYVTVPYSSLKTYNVSVPGLPDLSVEVAIKNPTTTEVGTLVAAAGEGGTFWWSGSVGFDAMIDDDFCAAGWRVVQTRWVGASGEGWYLTDPPTPPLGPPTLAARSATILRKIHTLYCRGGVDNMCVTGQSGGGSQMAYSLTHYGCKDIVRRALLSGGPPHGALAKMCGNVTGYGGTLFQGTNQIDHSYGQPDSPFGAMGTNITPAQAASWGRKFRFDIPLLNGLGGYANPFVPAVTYDFTSGDRARRAPWRARGTTRQHYAASRSPRPRDRQLPERRLHRSA